MRSRTTPRFRDLFARLPVAVQERAKRAYRLFRANPAHPGLHFKNLEGHDTLYSVRIGLHHRALGDVAGDEVVWVWIGSHAEYDRLI